MIVVFEWNYFDVPDADGSSILSHLYKRNEFSLICLDSYMWCDVT